MDLRENLRMTKRKIRRGKIRVYSAYLIFKYSFWYLFCQKVHVEIKLLISVTLDFGNHKWARTERYIFDIWSYQTVRMYQINYWKYMRLRKCVLLFIFRFGLPDHNLSDFKMDIMKWIYIYEIFIYHQHRKCPNLKNYFAAVHSFSQVSCKAHFMQVRRDCFWNPRLLK